MNLGLEGKVALVCGSSRGLGRAVAAELAAEGASVAVCARDAERLGVAAGEIEETGADVLAVPADLAVSGEPTRVVEACLEHLRKAHNVVLFDDPPEVLALELRSALEELGAIVGAVYTDDLLDRIFSRFCIGK